MKTSLDKKVQKAQNANVQVNVISETKSNMYIRSVVILFGGIVTVAM
jgi:hypothetical protein